MALNRVHHDLLGSTSEPGLIRTELTELILGQAEDLAERLVIVKMRLIGIQMASKWG